MQAIEVRPGVRSVVHHVLVFSQGTGTAPVPRLPPFVHARDAEDARGPTSSGAEPESRRVDRDDGARHQRDDVSARRPRMRIKAGSTLMFQIHYTANGKAAEGSNERRSDFREATAAAGDSQQRVHESDVQAAAGAPDTEVDSASSSTRTRTSRRCSRTRICAARAGSITLVYPDGRIGSGACRAELRFQLADVLHLHEAAGGAEGLALRGRRALRQFGEQPVESRSQRSKCIGASRPGRRCSIPA